MKKTKAKSQNTIKATLVYVGNFGKNKIFIDGTEEDAKDLSYYIKRGIKAVEMLEEEPIKKVLQSKKPTKGN